MTIIKNLIFPDRFVEHKSPDDQYLDIGMDSNSIAKKILNFFEDKVIDINSFIKTNIT